jgi:2'-5' RNA ligase
MARTRTFIAVPLSEAIRDELAALRRELERGLADMKWTETQNLHITLVFLGEVDDRELPEVCRLTQAAVDAVELRAFPLRVAGLGCFPHPRRPRVLWAGVDEGAEELKLLHAALADQLAALGFRQEDRPFEPHVTLGRTKSGGPVRELAALLSAKANWRAGGQTAAEVHVMGSELTPRGPRYTLIGRARLGAGG